MLQQFLTFVVQNFSPYNLCQKSYIEVFLAYEDNFWWFGRPFWAIWAVFVKPTLVSRMEVQDILIIFQHFSSQDILIRDRTVISLGKRPK